METQPHNVIVEDVDSRTGPGTVSHDLYGLEGDHRYSASVEVSSFSWTSLSIKRDFGEAPLIDIACVHTLYWDFNEDIACVYIPIYLSIID